jgi:carbonic anhydrase/acetyltransferase-like protein (isoleucine patch superfamily)
MPIYALNDRKPRLPPAGRFWIAPNAYVIGDVVLGEDCGVWFGATLRGDNEPITLGARVNVQEGATLHTDMGFPVVVGDDATIGHGAILHGCAVGESSLIGMGAIILNGATIGRGSLVGAGALVTEGKSFPENSLIIGAPARVARALDPAAVAAQRDWAAHYVENWRCFAAGLVEIG